MRDCSDPSVAEDCLGLGVCKGDKQQSHDFFSIFPHHVGCKTENDYSQT